MKRSFSPLVPYALGAALWFSTAPLSGQTGHPLGPDDGIVFDQVAFSFGDGAFYPFSPWGGMWVDLDVFCERAPLPRGFINVETERGWVVQNLPVDCQERLISNDPITVYFELNDPLDHFTLVIDLPASVELSSEPPAFFSPPPESRIPFALPHTTKRATSGCTAEPVLTFSTPPPPVTEPSTGETESHYLPNAVNKQTAAGQCFPMSIANSLQYLENRYGLEVPNDHESGLAGDETLVGVLDQRGGRPVTDRRTGTGTPHRSMMRAKLEYIDDNDLEDSMVMRHQGRGYGSEPLEDGDVSVGTFFEVTSTDDGPTVSWEWICDQIKAGEDVEVTYQWTGGGHAVRIYACGKTNGRPWVRYLHDGDQETDEAGLETVFVYMDDLDEDGTPNFGGPDDEVRFAWSESVTADIKNGDDAPPQTLSDSIVSGASFLSSRLTAAAIGTVFGIFRPAPSGQLAEEGAVEQDGGIPTELNGVQVWINGEAVPLFFAGEGQINFLTPTDLEPGFASLMVTVDGVPSDLVSFPVLESAPAMFSLRADIAGSGRAVAQNGDFSINLPDNPAGSGEALILYLTGTGPTNPPIPTGELAPSDPLARLTLPTTVTIGGQPATVLFAGAAPGFAGLTQINVVVPALEAGDHEVVVTVGGEASPGQLVAIGPAP